MPETAALLRLLQITDSSFPIGGFAFSHGLESLAKRRIVVTEAQLAELVQANVWQCAAGQALPAALMARRATPGAAIRRIDEALDASFVAESEREAGRAMGERLLVSAAQAFGPGVRADVLLDDVRRGESPGQYAVAFGVIGADQRVPEEALLSAMAFSMVLALAQAAVRLNLIGQSGGARLAAGATDSIERVVLRTLTTPRRQVFGAFVPNLDVAMLLHRTLPFRMFAS